MERVRLLVGEMGVEEVGWARIGVVDLRRRRRRMGRYMIVAVLFCLSGEDENVF